MMRFLIVTALVIGGLYWFAETLTAERNRIYYGEPASLVHSRPEQAAPMSSHQENTP